ncbi:cytochrome c oxidase accessory protein CcoG [Echinicola vietnamensis]|uniref:Cytochrome c oxidase accessory protein FixG n=1 Tax=Echinicola vietnamensis (strain DSM 17526 / LMG 23754 / KMM 6221) TaxID=926556 RepID=L0G0Q7_ECHVK|nr:cytochrome c oxidase accessory protein CcoG [Echinicola vietnamensis]AGA79127.1 cytochrome c oxidase accessory protein FixG [Echinicola vietnamensis DSM 17526]
MSEKQQNSQEAFRDSLATVKPDGGRNWIYPKKVTGFFYKWRTWLSWLLLAMLFVGPFLKIDGEPLLLLNVFERKFVIFGQVFWPQDTYILLFLLLILFVFIILFTVVFGRVFCGWICPQTLFMEMVFRKIEYWIEGDASQQRKLNAMPWNRKKILKKGAKFGIFSLISLLIAHTVMAYLIGIEETLETISHPPSENLAGFMGLLFFAGIFMLVFSLFREQVCTVVCPYGRLQGVLLDTNSINVSYDYVRGEPRGKINKKKTEEPPKGDCIDCTLCVQVCPTGIDIRNGVQMECVNCTACMDACDEVMEKVNRPKGLIRYASENSIKEGHQKLITPRVMGYSAVLVLLIAAFVGLLMTRTELSATITRFRGMTYQERTDGQVSNLYEATFINKTFEAQEVQIKAVDDRYQIEANDQGHWLLEGQSKLEGRFFLVIERIDVQEINETVTLLLLQNGEVIDEISTNFMAPLPDKNK